jgi:hypothetical protein
VYIANREIDGPIFVMPCSNGYGCFIASKDDGAKDRSMRFRVLLGNNVLNIVSGSLL